jgi:large subunit ribosomal protein L21
MIKYYGVGISARVGFKNITLSPARLILKEVQCLMYAIIKTGGKQYRVTEGDVIFVEKLPYAEGDKVKFDEVLLVGGDGEIKTGTPVIDGASVEATVLKNGKARKIIVFKYKPKKDYRRKQGHRQPYTKVQIDKINA